ncbi:hypothetical protein, partial [Cupriavidus necator]
RAAESANRPQSGCEVNSIAPNLIALAQKSSRTVDLDGGERCFGFMGFDFGAADDAALCQSRRADPSL